MATTIADSPFWIGTKCSEMSVWGWTGATSLVCALEVGVLDILKSPPWSPTFSKLWFFGRMYLEYQNLNLSTKFNTKFNDGKFCSYCCGWLSKNCPRHSLAFRRSKPNHEVFQRRSERCIPGRHSYSCKHVTLQSPVLQDRLNWFLHRWCNQQSHERK